MIFGFLISLGKNEGIRGLAPISSNDGRLLFLYAPRGLSYCKTKVDGSKNSCRADEKETTQGFCGKALTVIGSMHLWTAYIRGFLGATLKFGR
jgi:hypothetical protein